jgi:hypothetical protein
VVNSDTETPPRVSVHAFDNASAASPFGIKDLIGNVRVVVSRAGKRKSRPQKESTRIGTHAHTYMHDVLSHA